MLDQAHLNPYLLQVNLCYLCQACTSLLHSRKMLQHYLQVRLAGPWVLLLASVCLCLHSHFSNLQNKNGNGRPSAAGPRLQRQLATLSTSSKQPSADTEASKQRALHAVQYALLKILCRTLAALRHFTPDVCQILLDQVPHCPPCSSQTFAMCASGHARAFVHVFLDSPWTWPSTTSCLP